MVLMDVVIYGAEESGLSAVMTGIFIFILMGVTILKFLNVLKMGMFYEPAFIFVTYVLNLFCFFFILVGTMLTQSTTFAVYLWFATGLVMLGSIFFVVEIIIYLGNKATGGRLHERKRNEAIQNHYNGF